MNRPTFWYNLILIAVLLTSCGGTPPPTIANVTAAIGAQNVREGAAGATVPQSYTAHATFEVAGKPGQVFVCDTKRNCDAIFAYFDALKALAGPYTYQSGSGLVVVQLNSALTPTDAAKVEQAVKGL